MRKFFLMSSLAMISIFYSCKELNKKTIQLSSKSKKYHKELLAFANHEDGLHYVTFDTVKFVLIVKHDFEEAKMNKLEEFIKKNGLDSVSVTPTVSDVKLPKTDTIAVDTVKKDSIN